MKFRRLSLEELDLFKQEFIEFLAVNGIDADAWSNLKTNEHEKANGIIEAFSDMVFDTVLRKQVYFEQWFDKAVHTFHFMGQKAIWIGVNTNKTIEDQPLSEVLISDMYDMVYSEKTFTKSREEEVFDLIKKGAKPSDGKLYKKLILLYTTTQT